MANRQPNLDLLVFSIKDLEQEGTRRLPEGYRDYFNGGAMDMITCVYFNSNLPRAKLTEDPRLRENAAAYDRYKIRPRVLRNVSNIDSSAEFLGKRVTFPCGFSPSAMHQLAHPDGELATSRAAASMNIPMALSSYSTTSLEEVKAEGLHNPYMMQLCVVRDRNITLQLLARAEGMLLDSAVV
jgi:(S)-2-hydroxy-acid oxidase